MASSHLLMTILTCFYFTSADENFELLFKTNLETFSDLPVESETPLPGWLKGEYIRNGLGQFEMGDRRVQHAFDAFAKLCKFSFNGSDTILFSTQMLNTNFRQDSVAENSIAPYLLFDAPDPPYSFTERMEAMMHGIDNTNINILAIKRASGDNFTFMAVSDFWQMYEFDIETLNTMQRINPAVPHEQAYVNQIVPLPLPSTAHPVQEYRTSNLISFVSIFDMRPWGKNKVNVIRIEDNEKREVIASIPVDTIPYMHSLGASKKYAIILAHPLSVNVWRMTRTANPSQSLDWKPEQKTQIYVVNLVSGKLYIIKTRVEAKFNMHHINSYQVSGNKIICDYVAYPDVKFMTSLTMNTMHNATLRNKIHPQAELVRYVINLKKNTAEIKHFPSTPGYEFVNTMDMPAINEAYRFKKHCYVYGVTFKSDNITMTNTTLSKKNLCHPGRDKAWLELKQYVSEPWFVARPGGTKEDDGILISLIMDGTKGQSYLGVFDARMMKMINRIYVPTAIPFTIHGRFLDYSFLHKGS